MFASSKVFTQCKTGSWELHGKMISRKSGVTKNLAMSSCLMAAGLFGCTDGRENYKNQAIKQTEPGHDSDD